MLAPVGNSITTDTSDASTIQFEGYRTILVNSGTAALTLALRIASDASASNKQEVIIPAYACPDLVTACIGAGLTPVLCDINKNDPCYDLPMLESLVSNNTLAVMAINFLGIREISFIWYLSNLLGIQAILLGIR